MWLLQSTIDRCAGTASTSGRTTILHRQPAAEWRCKTRVQTHAAQSKQGSKQQQPKLSARNAQLYELSDDDGWGVEVAPAGSSSSSSSAAKQPAKQRAGGAQPPAKKARRQGTPFVDMRSEEGIFGLTLLQKHLLEQEEQQAAGQGQANSSSSSSWQAARGTMPQATGPGGRRKPKLPGFPGGAAGAAAALAALKQQQQQYDEDEYEDDQEAAPEFQLVFDKGKAEFTDFATGSTRTSDLAEGVEDDSAGWELEGVEQQEEEGEEDEGYGVGVRTAAAMQRRQTIGAGENEEHDIESSLIMDLSNEDDWGLEALNPRSSSLLQQRQRSGGRRSLLDELAAEELEADGFEEGSLAGSSASVQWGGSAGTTGIDLDEQEQILQRYFRPDQVKKLMKDQVEIDASYSELKKRAVGLGVSDHKYQQTLRIVSGSAAGKKLISFRGSQTRPMMEKVRQAIFNMIQSQAGTVNCLPKKARWLDLFAGTGSVGIEALSRGAKEAHFVEMDPVVVQKILSRNILQCGFKGRATCHTTKAEDFLRRAAALPRFAGGPFDFISVCPPYLLVSYPELFDLLEESPLLHPGSIVFVEYPKQLSHQVRDSIGPLQRVKDRKYGRTYVAVYASGHSGDGGEDLTVESDPFLTSGL